MDLAPCVEPEDDYARFAASVRRGRTLWFQEGPGGEFASSALFCAGLVQHHGRTVQWVQLEYVYASTPSLSAAPVSLACLRFVAARWLRHAGVPTYFAGPSYLPSFLSGLDGISRFYTATDPELPAEQKSLIHALAPHVCGETWDPTSGLVVLRTRPKDRRHRRPRRPETRALYDRYVDENPDWLEGRCLFLLTPIDARWVAEFCLQLVRRRLRRVR